MRAAAGVVVVAAHALGFVGLAARCHGTALAVTDGAPPAELAARTEITDEGDGPGLHHQRWTVRYRGGFTRTVGTTRLVGPFQDPAAPACSGRIVVGQRMLDALGPTLAATIDRELAGSSVFAAGAYRRVEHLALRWAVTARHPEDVTLVGLAPFGYVRVTLTVVFDRVQVPLVLALIPQPSAAAPSFRIATRAELDFGNRTLQWLSDKIGGDAFATRLARGQIEGAVASTLAPPPPLELPGGKSLGFRYCSGLPEIAEGAWGALPFAVEIGRVDGAPAILPPRRGPAARRRIAPGATLAIDLDLDALNAVLYELWRDGVLDQQLVDAGLHTRFNTDPIVTALLSIRVSPPRLALPPVVTPAPDGLRLSVEARITITDGPTATTARVWGGLGFAFAPAAVEPANVDLAALELTCDSGPSTLVPCYADLVAAMRDRGADFHGALTATFTKLLRELFVERRLAAAGLPAELEIRGVVPTVTTTPANASLHLDLDAILVEPR